MRVLGIFIRHDDDGREFQVSSPKEAISIIEFCAEMFPEDSYSVITKYVKE